LEATKIWKWQEIGNGEDLEVARIRRRRRSQGGEDFKAASIWKYQAFIGYGRPPPAQVARG